MKNTFKIKAIRRIAGIIAFVALIGFSFSGCASLKIFDKDVPAEQSAIIHMNEGCMIQTIDGKGVSGFTLGGSASETKGKGSDKYSGKVENKQLQRKNNAKASTAIIQIPAGQHEIFGSIAGQRSNFRVTFNFLAGHHYEMVRDYSQIGEEGGQSVGRALGGLASGGGMIFTFHDVTDLVKK